MDGADEFEWENQGEPKSEFSFGLDGSHHQIDPFHQSSEINEWEGNEEQESFEEFEEPMSQPGEIPEGFPDLTGMTGDQMKQTVIDWIEADPDNRKQQIMQMLPELSSFIM